MADKNCPNCETRIIYNPEKSESGMVVCLCGFPLLLPKDEYLVIEMDESKEKIIACASSFETI